jgi:hypothetical protein
VWPASARLSVMDSMNGAVGSPSNRGYDDVIEKTRTGPLGLAEDVLDELLDAMALVHPLRVLRRDELGEQAE